jgi:hypothetical protein
MILKNYKLSVCNILEHPVYLESNRNVVLMENLDTLQHVLENSNGGLARDSLRYLAIDPTSLLNSNTGIMVC